MKNNWNKRVLLLITIPILLVIINVSLFTGTTTRSSFWQYASPYQETVPVDNFPPTIDNPEDIHYTVGETGNGITWNPSDDYPQHFEILKDSTIERSGPWTGGAVSIAVDGLPVNVYSYLIFVYDETGNWASDEVKVTVETVPVDNTPPIIDSPEDIHYTVGETGNGITWNPSDDYPQRFEILKDGIIESSGPWSGGAVSIAVDGLSVGVYSYLIFVYDETGNWASDEVKVTVMEENTTTSPAITFGTPGFELLIAIAILGAASIYRKRKLP